MSSMERVRKKIEAPPPPVDPSLSRRFWIGGAVLGVLAGVVFVVFAVPPIFDHYFGVADIELGQTYRSDGIALTVEEVSTEFVVDRLEVAVVLLVEDPEARWCPHPTSIRAELSSGFRVLPESSDPPLSAPCVPGALTGPVTLTFSFPRVTEGDPHILHIDDPRVRLYLRPGKPGE
ncbi:MAG: hypothetical protein AB7T37_10990 [Dehalococcoidia bacterium]